MHKIFFGLGMATSMCLLSLVGCSMAGGSQKQAWVTNESVPASELPNAVTQFVDRSGTKVGQRNPHVVSAKTDIDDATQKPMYDITISGDFSYEGHHAKELSLIVLADGSAGHFTDPNDNAFNEIKLFGN